MTRTMTSKAPGSGTSISSSWKASLGSPKRSSRMTQAVIVSGSVPGSVATVETCVTSTAIVLEKPSGDRYRSVLRGANHTPDRGDGAPTGRRRSVVAEEASPAEEPQQDHGRGDHAADPVAPEGRGRVDVAHERAEVLAEEAGDERQRQESRGDHRQLLGDRVEAVGDGGEVEVQRARQQVAVGVDQLRDAHQ